MNRFPNGTKVFILNKTIGICFENTVIYEKGQNFGYVRGWEEEMDCYIVRWNNEIEEIGEYFMPSDITIGINKGRK